VNWLLDLLFGARIEGETARQVERLRLEPVLRSRQKVTGILTSFTSHNGSKAHFGSTTWGQPVRIPIDQLVSGYGLATGATGAGKTRAALLIVKSLLDLLPYQKVSFGVLDPKGDLYSGMLYLLKERLSTLRASDPMGYERLLDRIILYDFSLRDPISSYNILARWPNIEADFFAANRSDLLLDLLEGSDSISLTATSVLKRLILLLSEFELPITRLGDVLHDEDYRRRLVTEATSSRLKKYFSRQFLHVPTPTILAIDRRIEALFFPRP
jgi:hypothetical protein